MEEHQRTDSPSGLILIAEAATAHGGDFDLACDMIEAAASAGATHVKFQHVDPEHFGPDAVWKGYPLRDWFRESGLGISNLLFLKGKSEDCGLRFLCTPQTLGDFGDLVMVGIDQVKISSDNLTNGPLLEAVNRWGGTVYLSTGMASETDVRAAIWRLHRCNLHVLVCTSEYPCPPEHANLRRLHQTGVHGFSDHTKGATAALVALGLGACIFEKHFYLEGRAHGPDADPSFALNERELRSYFTALKRGYKMLGSGRWEPTKEALAAKEIA